MVPWADIVYGCDAAWWRHRRGLPEFRGLKLSWSGNGLDHALGVRGVDIAKGAFGYADELQWSRVGEVGGGGNSGFQALNLTAQFGAARIALVGFDMSAAHGVHWYGRNRWPMSANPTESNFGRWMKAYERAAPVLAARGIEVVNTSAKSALKCFAKVSLDDVMERWL